MLVGLVSCDKGHTQRKASLRVGMRSVCHRWVLALAYPGPV